MERGRQLPHLDVLHSRGEGELQSFLRERRMDERGMHVLTSLWEGLRIDTVADAHDFLLIETSVRSYIGTVRGDHHQYLPLPVHHAPYGYLDRTVQEHIMQLADPHNWLQSCFLLAPRRPNDPLPPIPHPFPPMPRIDVHAIERLLEVVGGVRVTGGDLHVIGPRAAFELLR